MTAGSARPEARMPRGRAPMGGVADRRTLGALQPEA
jgi:hypothetical protein